MKALILGILGAVAAVVYWRYTVSVDPLLQHSAAASTVVVDALIYAAAGFVIGWVVGFALSNIGTGKY